MLKVLVPHENGEPIASYWQGVIYITGFIQRWVKDHVPEFAQADLVSCTTEDLRDLRKNYGYSIILIHYVEEENSVRLKHRFLNISSKKPRSEEPPLIISEESGEEGFFQFRIVLSQNLLSVAGRDIPLIPCLICGEAPNSGDAVDSLSAVVKNSEEAEIIVSIFRQSGIHVESNKQHESQKAQNVISLLACGCDSSIAKLKLLEVMTQGKGAGGKISSRIVRSVFEDLSYLPMKRRQEKAPVVAEVTTSTDEWGRKDKYWLHSLRQ